MNTLMNLYRGRPLWHWFGLIIGVVVILSVSTYYLLPENRDNKKMQPDAGEDTSTVQPPTSVDARTPAEEVSTPTAGVKTPTSSPTINLNLTYAEAREISLYRFYFDSNCNGSTSATSFGQINVKQGSNVMLENHGEASQVLAVGNDARTVPAGGFVVMTAPNVKVTTGLYITCDGKGAGNLFVNP